MAAIVFEVVGVVVLAMVALRKFHKSLWELWQ